MNIKYRIQSKLWKKITVLVAIAAILVVGMPSNILYASTDTQLVTTVTAQYNQQFVTSDEGEEVEYTTSETRTFDMSPTSNAQSLVDQGYTYVESQEDALTTLAVAISNCTAEVDLCFDEGTVDCAKLFATIALCKGSLTTYSNYNIQSYSAQYSRNYVRISFGWIQSATETEAVELAMQILVPILNQGTDYQKILAVHDFICNRINYDYDTLNGKADKFAAFDGLYGYSAVCSGYAMLFQKFMEEMGIESYIASGIVNGGGHAWNVVKVGGQWYHVDCTWDGQDVATYHNFFLKGSISSGYSVWGGAQLSMYDYAG